MAIYKPSNFYPSLDELDWSNIEGQEFECQINTDGAKASAYKIQILSSNGVLLYENLGNFANPIKNKEFAKFPINLYDVTDANTEYGDNKSEILLCNSSSVNFIGLSKNTDFGTRKEYIPYCIYNILNSDINYFCIYHVSGENIEQLNIDKYIKNDTKVTVPKFTYSSGDKLFIGLKNGFDYKWIVRIYEDAIQDQKINNSKNRNTYVSSGYLTGTNQNVIWTKINDMEFQNIDDEEKNLSTYELAQNYLKMDNYVELRANQDNSDIFKNQLKKGFIMTTEATYSTDKGIFTCIDPSNIVDLSDYIEDMYVQVSTKEEVEYVSDLSTLNKDNVFFLQVFKTKTGTTTNKFVYYCFDKISLNQTTDTVTFSFYNKNLSSYFIDGKTYDVQFYYTKREKIYDTVNNLGQKKDITQILLDKEFDEYLKNGQNYYLYTCDNQNTNKIFYGNPRGEIQVGRYVRFPTIDGKEFNQKNFPSGSVKTDETIEKQGMFVKTQYFNLNVENKENTCVGFCGLQGLRNDGTNIWGQNNLVWVENEIDSNYRLMYYNPNVGTNNNPYRMLISKEEYQSKSLGTDMVGVEGTSNYYLKIKEEFASVPTAYGAFLQETSNPTFVNGKYYKIIVPETYSGAESTLAYDENNNGQVCFYLTCYYDKISSSDTQMKLPYLTGDGLMYFKINPVKTPTTKPGEYSVLKSTDTMFTSTYKNKNNPTDENNDISYKIKVPQGVKGSIYDSEQNLWYLLINPRLVVSEEDYEKVKGTDNANVVKYDNEGGYYYIAMDILPTAGVNEINTIGCAIRTGFNSTTNTYSFKVTVPKGFKNAKADTTYSSSNPYYYVETKGNVLQRDMINNNKSKFKQNKNFILYKIIGYDSDTGEIRLENETYRALTDTDLYEIWERYEESGESTTEYYTRRLPLASETTEYLHIGGEVKANMPCLNTALETKKLFIQPNINMKSDENFNPCLIFETGDRIDLTYQYDTNENKDYNKRDKTIDILDNSQWIISTEDTPYPTSCGSEYSIYTNYSDSFPENYFYARKIASDIQIKYVEASNYDEIDINNYPMLGDDVLLSIPVVRTMDCMFVGIYNGETALKRYRFKIFDETDDIIEDTQDVYSNDICLRMNGLNNGSTYTIYLEIEDQLGYIYRYKKQFIVQYSMATNVITSTHLTLKTADKGNGITFYFPEEDLSLLKQYTEEILVYKHRQNNKLEFVTSLNVMEKSLVEIEEGFKVLGAIDYNVVNDSRYEYIFVIQKNITSFTPTVNKTDYIVINKPIFTCFKQWGLYNLNKISDDTFEVDEVWELKCNIADEEVVQNITHQQINVIDKYSQVLIGENNYNTGRISCLLGDVSKYVFNNNTDQSQTKEGYNEFNNNKEYNNADLLADWSEMCATSNIKLLQDYKGNKWLVSIIETPSYSINLNTSEQMSTVNCNWVEIMSSENISIIKELTPFKENLTQTEEAIQVLKSNWTSVSTVGNEIILDTYKNDAQEPENVTLPFILGYTYTIKINNETSPFSNISNTMSSFTVVGGMNVKFQRNDNTTLIDNDASYLFSGCQNLQSIDCSSLLNSNTIISYHSMFQGCENLKYNLTFSQEQNIDVVDICKDIGTNSAFQFTINAENCELYDDLSNQYPQYDISTHKVTILSPYLSDVSDTTEWEKSGKTLNQYLGNKNTVFLSTKINQTIRFKEGCFKDTSVEKIAIPNKYYLLNDTDNLFALSNINYVSCKYNTALYTDDDFVYLDENKTDLLFYYKNQESVVIPKSVTKIEKYAFSNRIIKNISYYSSIEDGKLKTDDLTNFSTVGIQSIGEYCFAGCKNLIYLSLPTSITSIGPSETSNIFTANTSIQYVSINRDTDNDMMQTILDYICSYKSNLGYVFEYQWNCMNWGYCGITESIVDGDTAYISGLKSLDSDGLKETDTIWKLQRITNNDTNQENYFRIGFYKNDNNYNCTAIKSYTWDDIYKTNTLIFNRYNPCQIYISDEIGYISSYGLYEKTSNKINSVNTIVIEKRDTNTCIFGNDCFSSDSFRNIQSLYIYDDISIGIYILKERCFKNTNLQTVYRIKNSIITEDGSILFLKVYDNVFWGTKLDTISIGCISSSNKKACLYSDNSLAGMSNLEKVEGQTTQVSYESFVINDFSTYEFWDKNSSFAIVNNPSKGANGTMVEFHFYKKDMNVNFDKITKTLNIEFGSNYIYSDDSWTTLVSPFLANKDIIETVNITMLNEDRTLSPALLYDLGNIKINLNNSVKFIGVGSLANISLNVINGIDEVIEIYNYGLECSNIQNLVFPKLEKIWTESFEYCTSLQTINCPNLTFIGSNAFGECISLSNVNFGINKDKNEDPILDDNNYKIQEYAFKGCTSLKQIYIPSFIADISQEAFSSCINLTTININLYETDITNVIAKNVKFGAINATLYWKTSPWNCRRVYFLHNNLYVKNRSSDVLTPQTVTDFTCSKIIVDTPYFIGIPKLLNITGTRNKCELILSSNVVTLDTNAIYRGTFWDSEYASSQQLFSNVNCKSINRYIYYYYISKTNGNNIILWLHDEMTSDNYNPPFTCLPSNISMYGTYKFSLTEEEIENVEYIGGNSNNIPYTIYNSTIQEYIVNDRIGKCIVKGKDSTSFDDIISIYSFDSTFTLTSIWLPKTIKYINSVVSSISTINYEGTEEEWKDVYVNANLSNITINYNQTKTS